jgi:hypothetical protein
MFEEDEDCGLRRMSRRGALCLMISLCVGADELRAADGYLLELTAECAFAPAATASQELS